MQKHLHHSFKRNSAITVCGKLLQWHTPTLRLDVGIVGLLLLQAVSWIRSFSKIAYSAANYKENVMVRIKLSGTFLNDADSVNFKVCKRKFMSDTVMKTAGFRISLSTVRPQRFIFVHSISYESARAFSKLKSAYLTCKIASQWRVECASSLNKCCTPRRTMWELAVELQCCYNIYGDNEGKKKRNW